MRLGEIGSDQMRNTLSATLPLPHIRATKEALFFVPPNREHFEVSFERENLVPESGKRASKVSKGVKRPPAIDEEERRLIK